MVMNDTYWMVPGIVVTIMAIVCILIVGAKLEANRIYNNCMETNKTMIHQDAVKICKEIVK